MIKKIKRKQNIRGKPKCRGCGADIRKLFNEGKTVYSNNSTKIKYYCYKCKNEQFGGVRLREEE